MSNRNNQNRKKKGNAEPRPEHVELPDSSSDEEQGECGKCDKPVIRGEQALTCDLCDRWFHKACEKVKDHVYHTIDKSKPEDNICWFCTGCRCSAIPINKKLFELEKRITTVEEEKMSKQEAKDLIQRKVDELKTDTNKDMETKAAQLVDSKIQQKLTEQMKEQKDIERRSNNIIIHKLPEKENEVPQKMALDTLKLCAKNLSEDDIEMAKRLGAKEPDKTRPMLVKLKEGKKGTIMKNLKDLKGHTHKISITHDLPQQTRENRKKLLNEAKQQQGAEADSFLYKFRGPLGLEKVEAIKKDQDKNTEA